MTSPKVPESVLVVIYSADGRVLLLRRRDQPGFWQSVTGSLKPGETPLTAARREVREETGFGPDGLEDCGRCRRFPIRGAWRERYAAGATHNREQEFRLCVPAAAEPDLSGGEHDRASWRGRGEALALAASWTNRAAIRLLPVAPDQATVILVHGLWMGSPSMALLAWRLRRAGYRVRLFHYSSTAETPEAAARRLGRVTLRTRSPVVHFVAHSLGGIVLAHLFARGVTARTGRAVLLGSPMRDCQAARGMDRMGVAWALGKGGGGGLLGERPAWRTEVPVAAIAGSKPVGLGRLVARMDEASDGAVALRETEIPGAPRVILPVTHTGLLVNREVMARLLVWLRAGVLPGGESCGEPESAPVE